MSKRRDENEIVEVFYGISKKTFTVQSVYMTRGRVLSSSGDDLLGTHFVESGREPKHEIRMVWNLSDVVGFPILMDGREFANAKIAELHEKAATMKQASATAKDVS